MDTGIKYSDRKITNLDMIITFKQTIKNPLRWRTSSQRNGILVRIWIRILIEKADVTKEPVSTVSKIRQNIIVHKKMSKVTYFFNSNSTAIYFTMPYYVVKNSDWNENYD